MRAAILIALLCVACAAPAAAAQRKPRPPVVPAAIAPHEAELRVRYDPARLSESALLAAIDKVVDRLAN